MAGGCHCCLYLWVIPGKSLLYVVKASLSLVSRANYGTKYNIAVGRNTAGGQGWTHEFSFQAYNGPVPNTVPV